MVNRGLRDNTLPQDTVGKVLVGYLPCEPRTGGGGTLPSATAPPPLLLQDRSDLWRVIPPPSLGAVGLEAVWARYCQPHPSSDLSAWRCCAGNRGNYGGDALDEGVVNVEDVAFGVVQARQGGQFVVEAGSFPHHPQERTMCRSSSQCPSTCAHRTPPIARLVSLPARSSPPDPSVLGKRVQDYLTGAQDQPRRRRMQVEGEGSGGAGF